MAERFLSNLSEEGYDKHPASTDGGGITTSLQVFEIRSSYQFPLWEKHYGKSYTIYQDVY